MYDTFHRKIDYMRISITDRCNLRCRYCMPDGISLIPMDEILRYEEILTICREAVKLGICKFKITGGEPLVRKGCCNLIKEIKNIDDVKQVTLTSNGVILKEYLPELKSAGLDGINISLDTLDPVLFNQITGFDHFQQVMDSIHSAIDYGFHVKINSVLQKGINENEWPDLCELAQNMPLDVRFIELMPIGLGKEQEMISNEEILHRLEERYGPMIRDDRIHGNGPAIYYNLPGYQGSVGFISAIHGKFCDSCNRIRMTSTGEIKPCLCYEKSFSVREAVRRGDHMAVRSILEEAIRMKPEMHHFEAKEEITEYRKMSQIGG